MAFTRVMLKSRKDHKTAVFVVVLERTRLVLYSIVFIELS